MKRVITIFIAMALAGIASASIPQQINYQGQLTRASGQPLDTTVAMTFKLYSDSATGALLWTEARPSVSVAGGLFNVRLGQITSLSDAILNQAQVWLGITVAGDVEMTPRTRIMSSAYSYRVGTVDGSSGGTIVGDVNVVGKANIGFDNSNEGINSFVGGTNNHARGDYSVVGGGGAGAADSNSASGVDAMLGGGTKNTASAQYTTVSGGILNTASSLFATVSGGIVNMASGESATVSGGHNNTASGYGATVSGGEGNTASGYTATVSGQENSAAGAFAEAAGYRARANHTGAFVWGSNISNTDSTVSFNSYTFTVRCANGARFYTAQTGTATGVQLPSGGGAWSSLCDANQKNFHGGVNTSEILRKIVALPLHRWSYKSQSDAIQHIGPTAQDFHAAFGLGDNNTTISTLDPDGVTLAAIQELAKQNADLKDRLSKLESQLESYMAGDQKATKEGK